MDYLVYLYEYLCDCASDYGHKSTTLQVITCRGAVWWGGGENDVKVEDIQRILPNVVESTGDKVTDLAVGDVVIPTFLVECRECENFVSRESNFCLKYPITISALMQDNTSRMFTRGQKIFHLFRCSTFA
ncbi:hypothetical protein K1719_038925 [Acacia pycnantha]|nr:hypothetical protein K1719_038925 [Acacia pycnantha]